MTLRVPLVSGVEKNKDALASCGCGTAVRLVAALLGQPRRGRAVDSGASWAGPVGVVGREKFLSFF
jgi:hypothetical protein